MQSCSVYILKWYHVCNNDMLLDLATWVRKRQESHQIAKISNLCYCMNNQLKNKQFVLLYEQPIEKLAICVTVWTTNWHCNSSKQGNLLILIHFILRQPKQGVFQEMGWLCVVFSLVQIFV